MSPEKEPCWNENSSSNHQFFGGYISFQGCDGCVDFLLFQFDNLVPVHHWLVIRLAGINYSISGWFESEIGWLTRLLNNLHVPPSVSKIFDVSVVQNFSWFTSKNFTLDISQKAKFEMEVHPWKLTCPLKSDHFRGVANFQTRDLHCIPLDPWNDGIFTDPWMVDFFMVNVGRYTSPMDLMGLGIIEIFTYVNQPVDLNSTKCHGDPFSTSRWSGGVFRRGPRWAGKAGMNVGEVKGQAALGRFLQEATNITTCVTLLAGGFTDVFLVCTGFWGRCPIWLLFRWTLMSIHRSLWVIFVNQTTSHFTYKVVVV